MGLALVVIAALFNVVFAAARLVHPQPDAFQRTSMIDHCLQVPGKHLVLVQYQPRVPSYIEGVFNGADLNSQRVILAHDPGRTQDKILERYYSDRTVWTVTVGQAASEEPVYTLRLLHRPGAL
ncbi:MAG TPA: hypothetical protein VGH38_15225 [Bryobacteraceae bacterium]